MTPRTEKDVKYLGDLLLYNKYNFEVKYALPNTVILLILVEDAVV